MIFKGHKRDKVLEVVISESESELPMSNTNGPIVVTDYAD